MDQRVLAHLAAPRPPVVRRLRSGCVLTPPPRVASAVIQQELQAELDDPMLDLRKMTDSTVGDGYGSNSGAVGVGQTNTATVSMIRR